MLGLPKVAVITLLVLASSSDDRVGTIVLYGDPPIRFPLYELCQEHQCFDKLRPNDRRPNTKLEPHSRPQMKQSW